MTARAPELRNRDLRFPRMLMILSSCVMVLCGAVVTAAVAQPSPSGSEFHVNSFTPHDQIAPSVASDASGNFVVVWWSQYQESPLDYGGIFGQRFDAAGSPRGGEFHVNSYTTKDQITPSVASDAAGNFVVVWQSQYQESQYDFGGIFGQRYDSTGAPLGTEFHVNTNTLSVQSQPSVAIDGSGNFVVVWQSQYQESQYDYGGIFGQRYDSTGAPAGPEFHVNSYTTGHQEAPSVACDATGNFVVVWQSQYQESQDDYGGIFGQRFDSTGAPVGSEFHVNSITSGTQDGPSVATGPAGSFVVVWRSDSGSSYDSSEIFGQRIDSTGVPAGLEFQVNSYTTGAQSGPSIASDAAGNFVVVWHSSYQESHDDYGGIYGQRYDSTGAPAGPEFHVNSYTAGGQGGPAVASAPSGSFVVVWQSRGEESQYDDSGIFGQRFVPPSCDQVVCTPLDQCHDAGTCDPETGQCSNPAKADGAACNDGDACTQTDTCQAGACMGSNSIICTASDQCHAAGTCDPATGQCSNPAKADGTVCDDGDACTQTDTCEAGICVGANPNPACQSGLTPLAPAAGAQFFADSPPPAFMWTKGDHPLFRVEWSSATDFGSGTVVTSGAWRNAESFQPSAKLWLTILKLGLTNGTIQWRVRAKDGRALTPSSIVPLVLAGVQAPTVSAPEPGQAFSASEPPPSFSWTANHNAVHRITCSKSPDFTLPKHLPGAGYSIKTGTFTPSVLQWKALYKAIAKNSAGGIVYFKVEAKDSLGRPSASSASSFVLNP